MTSAESYMNSRHMASVSRYYRDTSHPHVELVPRGAVGLHAIARTCLSAGDRVLISPLTCHTVVEAFLQAGVVPQFTDIHPGDGNMDLARLRQDVLGNVKAVVTTNLYGNPDNAPDIARIARRMGLLMIEDCAHVLESSVGNMRIGCIGDLAVFSFKKFFGVPGGVVAGRDAGRIDAIREWVRRHCRFPAATSEISVWARRTARTMTPDGLLRLRDRLPPRAPVGGGIPLTGGAEEDGTGPAPGFRIRDFLMMPLREDLKQVAGLVEHPERFRESWDRGNRELISGVPMEYKKSPYSAAVVHMAVPFFCNKRDSVLNLLRGRGIPLWFLYDPPMNFRYGTAIPGSMTLELDRLEEWRHRILPLPGKHSARIVSEMAGMKDSIGPEYDGRVSPSL